MNKQFQHFDPRRGVLVAIVAFVLPETVTARVAWDAVSPDTLK